MKHPKGTLYGIGVGPGDPDLITLKSVQLLGKVHVVFAASSSRNDHSRAVQIARRHIPEATPVRLLPFPMSTDAAETAAAWNDITRIILETLQEGRDAAFLTLGDPMTYSTFGYILRYVRRLAPETPVVTSPGITSYQAAAACLNTPLVEGEESLLVVSGAQGGYRLRQMAQPPETVVFLKAYRHLEDICSALSEKALYSDCQAIAHCGLPEETIYPVMERLPDRHADYWTLVIAHQPRDHRSTPWSETKDHPCHQAP